MSKYSKDRKQAILSKLSPSNPQPLSLGHIYSVDLMSNNVHNNIRFQTFSMIDHYSHEELGIDISTPYLRVICYLYQVIE